MTRLRKRLIEDNDGAESRADDSSYLRATGFGCLPATPANHQKRSVLTRFARTVLSPEEVLQFLESVEHIKHRTILTACYAAGLRISEERKNVSLYLL